MTDYQIKLVQNNGQKFVDDCADILDALYYLPANALSLLTDDEWKDCAEALTKFSNELYKVRLKVYDKMEEAGVEF